MVAAAGCCGLAAGVIAGWRDCGLLWTGCWCNCGLRWAVGLLLVRFKASWHRRSTSSSPTGRRQPRNDDRPPSPPRGPRRPILPPANTALAGSPLKNKISGAAGALSKYVCRKRGVPPKGQPSGHGAARKSGRRSTSAAEAVADAADPGHGRIKGRAARPESEEAPGDAAGLPVLVHHDTLWRMDSRVAAQPHFFVRARIQPVTACVEIKGSRRVRLTG